MKVKSFFAMLFLATSILSASAQSQDQDIKKQDIKKGDTIKITSDLRHVRVMNLAPTTVKDSGFGRVCSIDHDNVGWITVIGVNKNLILVRLRVYGSLREGRSCPDETLFFITKEKFSEMEMQNKRCGIISAEKAKRDLVQRLLDQYK